MHARPDRRFRPAVASLEDRTAPSIFFPPPPPAEMPPPPEPDTPPPPKDGSK